MSKVTGVILAGGLSRRFGEGDKFLNKLTGRPLLNWVVERVSPQVDELILTTTAASGQMDGYNLPVVADVITGYAGPLAGILTGMEWVIANGSGEWIATFPADAPFIPTDMIKKLMDRATRDKAEIVCAASDGRIHPVCGLWQISLAGQLRQAMEQEKMRKADLWTERYNLSIVDFSTNPYDPFFNINRPVDMAAAEKIAALVGK